MYIYDGWMLNQNALNYTQLKIIEVSNKSITLEPENTLFDACNTLLRYNISRIVIARDNKGFRDSYRKGYFAYTIH
jgi:CBS domain-containing protein